MAKYRLDDILSDLGVPGSDKKAPKEPAPRYRIDETEDPLRPSTLSPVPLTPISTEASPAPTEVALPQAPPPPPQPAAIVTPAPTAQPAAARPARTKKAQESGAGVQGLSDIYNPDDTGDQQNVARLGDM